MTYLSKKPRIYTDFASIRGHKEVKRALSSCIVKCPPGCGKTILTDAFHTILADLSNSEM